MLADAYACSGNSAVYDVAVNRQKYPLGAARVVVLFQKRKKEADASYLPKSQTKNLTLGGRYLTHQPLCNILF